MAIAILGFLITIVVTIVGPRILSSIAPSEKPALKANIRAVQQELQRAIFMKDLEYPDGSPSAASKLSDYLEEGLSGISNPVNGGTKIQKSTQFRSSPAEHAIATTWVDDTMADYLDRDGPNNIYSQFPFEDYAEESAGTIIVRVCSDGYLIYASYNEEPFDIIKVEH